MGLVEKAITEYWGPRCPDFNPECFICRAWREYDELVSQQFRNNDIDGFKCPICFNAVDIYNKENNSCWYCRGKTEK